MSDDEAEQRPYGQLFLEGARFAGGRLPVEALVEIQRYQELVLESARQEWSRQHPEQELPADFDEAFQLTITEIGDGSAAVLLELERPAYTAPLPADALAIEVPNDGAPDVPEVHRSPSPSRPSLSDDEVVELFTRGLSELELQLRAAARPETRFNELPLLRSPAFQNFGRSLDEGEAVRVVAGAEPRANAPVVTPEVRKYRLEPLAHDLEVDDKKRDDKRKRDEAAKRNLTAWTPLAGRLVSLSPNTCQFVVDSLLQGEIKGRYSDPDLLDDLKRVLDSSARAPVIRMQANLQTSHGEPKRIKDIRDVELLEIDGRPWSRRFVELAQLGADWNGTNPGAAPISFTAMDAAREIMLRADDELARRPALFPTEEGGLLLEWSSPARLVSVEVSPDGAFDLLSLVREGRVSEQDVTENLEDAYAFIRGALA